MASFVLLFMLIVFKWQDGPATMVHFEQFKDLSESTYRVTISKVQQLALQKAGGPVPNPSQQLELLNKKKGKEQRSQPVDKYGI